MYSCIGIGTYIPIHTNTHVHEYRPSPSPTAGAKRGRMYYSIPTSVMFSHLSEVTLKAWNRASSRIFLLPITSSVTPNISHVLDKPSHKENRQYSIVISHLYVCTVHCLCKYSHVHLCMYVYWLQTSTICTHTHTHARTHTHTTHTHTS